MAPKTRDTPWEPTAGSIQAPCPECNGHKWHHGCCDDMCRGRGDAEAEDCTDPVPCKFCDGNGWLWYDPDDQPEATP